MTFSQIGLKSILLSGSVLVLASCSMSTEDTRISFCKTLASQMTGAPDAVVWTDTQKSMARFEDMQVDLRFKVNLGSGSSQSMAASCFYEYDVRNEQESMIGVDITQNYETAPHKMIFNGAVVPKGVLFDAVNKGLFVQAEANLRAIQKSATEAVQKVRETAAGN